MQKDLNIRQCKWLVFYVDNDFDIAYHCEKVKCGCKCSEQEASGMWSQIGSHVYIVCGPKRGYSRPTPCGDVGEADYKSDYSRSYWTGLGN